MFIVDENDLIVSHPVIPELVGRDIKTVVGSDGYELGKEIARATEDGHWIHYLWPNPAAGGVEEPKHTWAIRHDGLIFGSGYYEPTTVSTLFGGVSDVTAVLENPAQNSFRSGVSAISGWACDAEEIVVEINGEPLTAAYGTIREDTAEVCGDTDNGFSLLWNWNNLGTGVHTVRALIDGVPFAQSRVTVTTFGDEMLGDEEKSPLYPATSCKPRWTATTGTGVRRQSPTTTAKRASIGSGTCSSSTRTTSSSRIQSCPT